MRNPLAHRRQVRNHLIKKLKQPRLIPVRAHPRKVHPRIDRKDIGFDIEPEVDLLGATRSLEEERIDMESPTDPLTEDMIEGYIYDLMTSLKERAIDAKNTLENPETTDDDGYEFDRGYLMAYYRVISTMQAQASLFGLDQKTYNLSIINPDLELIPSNPKK